jgi:uncharacterized protein (DUF697 family)
MEETKEMEANVTVMKYLLGAAAASLIPVPAFDVVAISGIQLKMVHSLSGIYGVPFKKNAVKSAISALVSGIGATSIATGIFGSLIKAIPVVGPITGAITLSVLAGAATYAVGKVFIQHFETGGTFLDFEPDKVKKHFARLFEEGKKVVATEAEKVAEKARNAGEKPSDKADEKAGDKKDRDK